MRGPTVSRSPTRSLRAAQDPSRRKESQQVRTTAPQKILGSKWWLIGMGRCSCLFSLVSPSWVLFCINSGVPCLCRYLQRSLCLQREEATPRGADRQHLAEDQPDETETEQFGEKTREVVVLEAHSAERRRRGSSGRGPAGVLDVLPVKPAGSIKLTPILHQYLELGTSLIRFSWFVHTWGYLFLKVKMQER